MDPPRPLVSVVVPCHQHRAPLPWALASLVAQTQPDWECVLVDDGSTDAPREVVEALGDDRITFVRLPGNRGPAAARQVGVERARGAFIALLDADDWLYPTRLEAQLAAFAAEPGLSAVGSGMAVVDAGNRLLGLRGCQQRTGSGAALRPLPPRVGRPTVMLRGDLARAHRFDPGLRRTEDWDFLGRVLDGRRYRILPDPLYAYREEPRGAAARSLRAHGHRRRYLRKVAGRHPARAGARLLASYLKSAGYAVASTLALDAAVAAFRNRPASQRQREEFERASEAVARVVAAAGLEAR